MAEERPVSESGSTMVTPPGEESPPREGEIKTTSKRPSTLFFAGVIVVLGLVITGLLLPPISLGQRLFGSSETTDITSTSLPESRRENQLAIPGEIALSLNQPAANVNVSKVSQADFRSSADWSAATTALPGALTLQSDVYAVEYEGAAPVGRAAVTIPSEAEPYHTLDLYAWEGRAWQFVASEVDPNRRQIISAEGQLPRAFALMQVAAPTTPAVGAEVLPTQELPVEVLPHLTEVAAGTLSLNSDGSLQGDVVSVPTGAYDQLVRVTNTGVLVDQASLATLLGSNSLQEEQVRVLVDRAVAGNYAGVNLDYQGVSAGHSEAFTAFASSLADALHARGLTLAITLATPQEINGRWDTGGQDWSALGQVADVIYLQMPLTPTAYTDNGAAEQLLGWATRQINRHKINLLVSANAVDRLGEALLEMTNDQALTNFGELEFVAGAAEVEPGTPVEVALSGTASALEWDGASLTYKYSYGEPGQTHHVWLGNAAALRHRLDLASRYHLRGVTVRGLGDVGDGAGHAAALASYLGAADAPQPAGAAIVWTVRDENDSVLASGSGDALTFAWEGSESAGAYTIQADFALGDNVASLGALDIIVAAPPEPEPEPVAEEEPEAPEETEVTTTGGATTPSLDPGDADAVINVAANVRLGPSVGYGIIAGGLNPGARVKLTGRNADSSWLQILMPDGQTEGWVFANLVSVNPSINVSTLPVVEVAPPVASSPGNGTTPAPPPPSSAPPPVVTNTGFELGGQTHVFANPTLMASTGMRWVKFQHKWGPGDTPNAVAGRIQQAHASGFKVLLSIPGAQTYPSSIDFDAYVTFLGGVAALGPDAIEVWNEQNIDFEWPAGQIDPAAYVNNMLAPAYRAIKAANANVMVISGAPAPTGFDNGTNAWADNRYMAGMAAAGGANYMDCIGVHHNAGATSPSATSGHPTGSAHYSWYFFPTLNMYYNAFGGSRPVCFTELGYLSGADYGGVPSRFSWAGNTSVQQHADWLAEAASLSASSGRVRMLIVFNVDFTYWGEDPQAGYAMIRPGGGCPACETLRRVMGR